MMLDKRASQLSQNICGIFNILLKLDDCSQHVKPIGAGLKLIVSFKFVCIEVLRPSQPNGVMSSMVSLPNHTFTGQV